MAKISILMGAALIYAVITLYHDMSGLGDRLNQKIAECHESRVKELMEIYQKTGELEMRVRFNQEKVQENQKDIEKLKENKISYNN